MYQEVSQLLMYGDLDREGILYQLGELFGRYEKGVYDRMELVRDINTQVKHILKVATDYGFDDNLAQLSDFFSDDERKSFQSYL